MQNCSFTKNAYCTCMFKHLIFFIISICFDVGTDYYCSVELTNGQIISTLCNQGTHEWMVR